MLKEDSKKLIFHQHLRSASSILNLESSISYLSENCIFESNIIMLTHDYSA